MENKPLVNRVAQSSLITLNLENFYPKEEILELDIAEYLFRGLILREKDFRTAMEEHNWSQYEGKNLAVFCSADAIVPTWAYQLVAVYASPIANMIAFGNKATFVEQHYIRALSVINPSDYEDKRIVIKGCSEQEVPLCAYVELTRILRPVAKSIMFGEPCSTVPLYKKKK